MKRLTIVSTIFLSLLFVTLTSITMGQAQDVHDHSSHQESTSDGHQMNEDEHGHMKTIQESKVTDAAMSDFPTLHPLVVHFPIGLLLLAFLSHALSFFCWKHQLDRITLFLAFTGFVSAYLASTYFHPHTTQLSDAAALVLEEHEKWASFTQWTSGTMVLLHGIGLFFLKNKMWLRISCMVLLIGAAFSISRAGHYGATLTHIHGVGVQGNWIESEQDGHHHEH